VVHHLFVEQLIDHQLEGQTDPVHRREGSLEGVAYGPGSQRIPPLVDGLPTQGIRELIAEIGELTPVPVLGLGDEIADGE